MNLLEFLTKYGDILFRGYWCGGTNNLHKRRKGRTAPKPLEYALENFPWLLGALNPHIAVSDYDTKEAFDCRVKIAQTKKEYCVAIASSRGGHIYNFDTAHTVKTSNTKNRTLLSFYPVDYKLGYKVISSTGEIEQADNYACLSKEDKSLRELVYFNIREDRTLDEIPFYDLRVKASEKYDFLGMKEGDGRQGGLFTYMNPVKAAGYSYEQFKEAAELIEQFVLAVPLGDEFENAIRREAWDNAEATGQGQFYSGSTFLFDRFAAFLKNNYHIIKINNQLHIYQEGVYIRDVGGVSSAMRVHIPNIKRNQKAEVLDCLNDIAEEKTVANARYISFRNGILDITSGEMQPHTPEIVITNKIPWDYNPAASSTLVENTLNKISCGDVAIRALIEEMIGYCFYRSNAYKKSFLLVGDGDNGKSTLLYAVKEILGEGNISALDLKELGDRFKTAEMFGKLANIGDDIGDEFIANPAIFKKVVSGERVSAERKGRDPFEFNPYVKILLSANDIPQIKDKTGAVVNRLIILPFNAVFTRDDPDFNPTIRQDILQMECMECFIRLGVEGLKRIISNKGFTKSQATEQAAEEYSMMNNPIKGFFAEQEEDYIFRATVDEIYLAYQEYCRGIGVKPEQVETKISFGKSVTKMFKVESHQKKINGKNCRIYREQQQ